MRPPRREGGNRGAARRTTDWSELALPLPAATAEKIASIGRAPSRGDNIGLWLDKLIHRRRNGWTLKDADRSLALGALCRAWESEAGKAGAARLREAVEAVHPREEQRQCLRARVHGRLLVDYGRANVAETSVSFHPILGVPRIPGSALKGVTRAELRMDGLTEPELEDLFGAQSAAGPVLFYDALPEEGKFRLALDVLTPHHRDYYEGKGPPADWESPIPHSFLTVVEATFVIWLGARSARQQDVEALERASAALGKALVESGVGAKTAAGYGRFEVERGKA